LEGRLLLRAAQRRAISTRAATHRGGYRSRFQTRRDCGGLRQPHLRQYAGGGQDGSERSGEGQHPHAPYTPQSQDPLPQAAPEPQTQQKEAAALHQGPLAVETAPGHLSQPALSRERLRGGRHQSSDAAWQGTLERHLFSAASRQALVLRGVGQASCCPDQAGLRDTRTPRAVGTQEDGEEAGRGLGCALRRCMGVGLQCGRRAQVAGQYTLVVHHAFHLAPSATAPLPAREEWQAQALRRHPLTRHQTWHPGQTSEVGQSHRRRNEGWQAEFA